MAEELASHLGLMLETAFREALTRDAFALIPRVLSPERCVTLRDALSLAANENAAGSRRGESVYALRNVLALPEVQDVARSSTVRRLVESVLGSDAFVVRGIFFDKTPEANWPVPWHQDLSIAVRERRDIPGWGPWSVKAGVLHVQPPVAILERMLTVRLHLDDCPVENGALRVLPGTHRLGRLGATEIERLRNEIPEMVCSVQKGDALLMGPLLLHASSPAQHPGHRRVLHLEFAADDLPHGLEWAEHLS
jgi:ectoine hydroxylase-related dioxygenase (phytanoyl-CoA dioxygenase family)